MNFEELYKKYQDGTATAEEAQYVREEIDKARALSAILDEADARRVIEPSDGDRVRRARRRFGLRLGAKIALISLVCLLLLSTLLVGICYGVAVHSANAQAEYDLAEAEEIAKMSLSLYGILSSTPTTVTERDRELRFGTGLSDCYYVYEIDLLCGDREYEVEVDSRNGRAQITDVD